MASVAGIFTSHADAQRSVEELRRAGLPPDRVNLLTPASSERQVHSVETTDTEQPGMGKALGGVVGAVAGGTAGMGLGAAAASLLIPGVGPVAAVGLAAAALFGAGGAIAGAAAGGKLEDRLFPGLPKDEIYLYEDALRHGRSVVFALTDEEEQADRARTVLTRNGAESLEAAREKWWIGLRDAERSHYEQEGADFDAAEPHYRRGFEAALHGDFRGKALSDAVETLRERYGDSVVRPEFAQGYERGSARAKGAAETAADTRAPDTRPR